MESPRIRSPPVLSPCRSSTTSAQDDLGGPAHGRSTDTPPVLTPQTMSPAARAKQSGTGSRDEETVQKSTSVLWKRLAEQPESGGKPASVAKSLKFSSIIVGEKITKSSKHSTFTLSRRETPSSASRLSTESDRTKAVSASAGRDIDGKAKERKKKKKKKEADSDRLGAEGLVQRSSTGNEKSPCISSSRSITLVPISTLMEKNHPSGHKHRTSLEASSQTSDLRRQHIWLRGVIISKQIGSRKWQDQSKCQCFHRNSLQNKGEDQEEEEERG